MRKLIAVLIAFCIVSGNAIAAEMYGTVELVDGPVRIVDARGQGRLAQVDDKIFERETVITGREGELHIRTEDHGFVALRSNTRLRIDSYLANADEFDKTVISLLVGSLRSITGWIGKNQPQSYAIKSSTATIGVRGTDHETTVILPDEPGTPSLAAPGTYDKVNQGSTVITSEKGVVILQPNEAGFAPHEGPDGPRLLDSIPVFFKLSKHEDRINERRETLSKEMDAHRAARKKQHAEEKTQRPRLLVPKHKAGQKT
jgi:hypothetical protein